MTDKLEAIGEHHDVDHYQDLHWEGSFRDYLDTVEDDPRVLRTAYQRLYDMIMSHGTSTEKRRNQEITHYHFFDDPFNGGEDAIYGLEEPLMKLVDVLKAAAYEYGTEKRVILLHGPVGSSKSTIVRLIKRGLEDYTRQQEGRLYTFSWVIEDEDLLHITGGEERLEDPMNEEPLKLIPQQFRQEAISELDVPKEFREKVRGELNPASRFIQKKLMEHYDGDWKAVIENHVEVERLIFSEKDRTGIASFQPKDEKNQDSTELTGDINYRKIAKFGSDSDPRAFNFDGEFCVANRGIIEFVEILKLETAFLYDLLGATQERKIKPKKFAQTDIDEVIIGHSVAGHEPVMFKVDGQIRWSTMEDLHDDYQDRPEDVKVLSVDEDTGEVDWTEVENFHSHSFSGEILQSSQKWGAVETTPNHAIYNRDLEVFYPEDREEMKAVRNIPDVAGFDEHIDLDIDGLVSADECGDYTSVPEPGWSRLDKPRAATPFKTSYDVTSEEQQVKALLTLMAWYAADGHSNPEGRGVVISKADRSELERVQSAVKTICGASGSIGEGAADDGAFRYTIGSDVVRCILTDLCGEGASDKRLPDFVFNLPQMYRDHILEELVNSDGTRALTEELEEVAGSEYKDSFFGYKSVSPLLAAQVGTLATFRGVDYSVYVQKREDNRDAYKVRFCNESGKRGGRHDTCEKRLHRREVSNTTVYDIECGGPHNFVCGVGNVLCHNTNEPEYRKLLNNEYMEALRDRTVKIDIPYITTYDDEVKIYQKDFSDDKIQDKHIAPHTIEMASMWAVLTRLEEPKKQDMTLLQKLKLYNGTQVKGYTEDHVKELREVAEREGMEGISPRYIQDKLSNALVSRHADDTINPFLVLNQLESGLENHSLINDNEEQAKFKELLSVVKDEYEDIVKNEVQRAISADEEAIQNLCKNYINNVKAYTQKEKIENKYTGQREEPDERLMRSVEEKIDIPESRKDEFRRQVMNQVGARAVEGEKFDFDSNQRLRKALESKLFEDKKDTINLQSAMSEMVDKETQEKIDVIKQRLIDRFGYNEQSATDVLNFVSSIFARGEQKEVR